VVSVVDLLDRIVLPVASEDDAVASARALAEHDYGTVTVVHVVEKAGGAPDKAGVEQRELEAEDAFDVVRAALGNIETEIYYGTDVSETIFRAADDHLIEGLPVGVVVLFVRGNPRRRREGERVGAFEPLVVLLQRAVAFERSRRRDVERHEYPFSLPIQLHRNFDIGKLVRFDVQLARRRVNLHLLEAVLRQVLYVEL
jgi:hypothetical protein